MDTTLRTAVINALEKEVANMDKRIEFHAKEIKKHNQDRVMIMTDKELTLNAINNLEKTSV